MIYIGLLRFALLSDGRGKMFLVANIPIFSKATTFSTANGTEVGTHLYFYLRERLFIRSSWRDSRRRR